jgi:hypothetical protein
MKRFWITEEERKPGRFENGCTYLHFSEEWKTEKIGFNDDELDELRRVLGVGMGDCLHCEAWRQYSEPVSFSDRALVSFRENLVKTNKRIEELEMELQRIRDHLFAIGRRGQL